MRTFAEVEEIMHKLNIPYEIVEHPASQSTEESDHYIEGKEGCRSKTLFLSNRKSTQFYMVMMDDSKRIEMDAIADTLGSTKLHFASSERLEQMLGLHGGIISLFGLIGTYYENVHVFCDREMMKEHKIMTVHPNDNTKTLFFPMASIPEIMKSEGYTCRILDF